MDSVHVGRGVQAASVFSHRLGWILNWILKSLQRQCDEEKCELK